MDLYRLQELYTQKEDEELIAAINNPGDYNPETLKIIEAIISDRGGLEKLLEELEEKKTQKKELESISRIISLQLKRGYEVESIRSSIQSEFLSESEINYLFDHEIKKWEREEKDKKVTFKSLLGGLIGGVVGGTIGGALWGLMMIGSGKIFYIAGFGLLSVCYFFVRLFSRKSQANIGTFIITGLSVGFALIVGEILFSIVGVINR